MNVRTAVLLTLALAACNAPHVEGGAAPDPAVPAAAPAGIAWQSYASGLAAAKAEHRPVLLVISASWCPHCRNYKKVFHDPRVIAAARDFVMVRIDEDQEPAVAARYTRDGQYVPRTYFLAPDGTVADVQAENPRYRYFYDERNPASILRGMSTALQRAGATAAN